MRRELILGPPGTGKTTTLVRELDDLAEHYDPRRIAFVSFTNAAVNEARDRTAQQLGATREELHLFRTLHSMSAKILGWGKERWLTSAHWDEFVEQWPMPNPEKRETVPHAHSREARHQGYHQAFDKARALMRDRKRVAMDMGVGNMSEFEDFCRDLEAFKRERDVSDYTDCLEAMHARALSIPADVLIVDEAQDLSPLQVAVLAPTILSASVAIVAGDDDQAIFEFQGADPSLLIALAEQTEWNVRPLAQSHRVPAAVHRLAVDLIEQNNNRIPKSYLPRDEEGEVTLDGDWRDELQAIERAQGTESTFIACRVGYGLATTAYELHGRGVPYRMERGTGPCPYNATTQIRAIRAGLAIQKGKPITWSAVGDLLDLVPSSREPDALAPWGVKSKLPTGQDEATPRDLDGLGLGRLLRVLEEDGPVKPLLKLDRSRGAYWQTILDRYGCIPEPKVILSTIHGLKGREADRVVILDHEPTKRLSEARRTDPQGERRVEYVGMTRARRRLAFTPNGPASRFR